MKLIVLWLGVLSVTAAAQSVAPVIPLKPGPTHDPLGSVKGLVFRKLGYEYVDAFSYEVIPADSESGHDVFEVSVLVGSRA